MPLGPTGGRIMAEIVAAALAAHAPLITGKPEIARPEQRERLYAGFHEMRRRLAAARPDLLVMFVNDHLQNFPYSNLPAFCIGLVDSYDAPSPGGSKLMRIPARKIPGAPKWGMALLEAGLAGGFDFAYSYEIESWDELSVPLHFLNPEGDIPVATVYTNCAAPPLPTQFVYTVATGMSPSGLRKCSGTESSSHDSISYE